MSEVNPSNGVGMARGSGWTLLPREGGENEEDTEESLALVPVGYNSRALVVRTGTGCRNFGWIAPKRTYVPLTRPIDPTLAAYVILYKDHIEKKFKHEQLVAVDLAARTAFLVPLLTITFATASSVLIPCLSVPAGIAAGTMVYRLFRPEEIRSTNVEDRMAFLTNEYITTYNPTIVETSKLFKYISENWPDFDPTPCGCSTCTSVWNYIFKPQDSQALQQQTKSSWWWPFSQAQQEKNDAARSAIWNIFSRSKPPEQTNGKSEKQD